MIQLQGRLDLAERRMVEAEQAVAAHVRRISELEETVQTMNALLEDLAGRAATHGESAGSTST
jgi:hypothetical protein